MLRTQGITKIQAVIIAVIIIVVAVVGGGLYFSMPKRPVAPEAIRIGALVSLTGSLGAEGKALEWAYSKAVDDYNREGGVYVKEYGKKIPLQVIFADAKSDADAAATAAAKLILQDKVNFLVTSHPPPIAFPIASMAEKYKVPMVMHGGPNEPFIASGPWKYAWEYSFKLADVVDLWTELTLEYAEQTNKIVAVAVVGDVDGTEWYNMMIPKLKEIGLTPLELGTFPPGTSDFTALIQEWKRQNAEIFWANCDVDSFTILWRQCAEQGYRPKLALVGRAVLDASSAEALGGDLAEGIITEAWWHPDFPWATPPFSGSRQFAEMYEKERGLPWVMPLGAAYAQIQIIVDAISRAGTLDPDKVNEAIGQSTIVTPLGPVHFDPETHACACDLVQGQWRKTEKGWELAIVYSKNPEIKPTAEMEFPLPPL